MQISWHYIRIKHKYWLSNHFKTLHSARQYYCRGLCEIWKRLGNENELWANEISWDLSWRGMFYIVTVSDISLFLFIGVQ